jgi:Mrp family chromosome partitioning ATPase
MVQKAVEHLELAQANVLGVVLNDVDVNKAGYSSYYHKYYSGYYGEQSSGQ